MAQIPRPKSQNAAQVYKAFELTADFVVGLDAAALDDARIELTKNVKRFEDHFQTVNGRKPTRQVCCGHSRTPACLDRPILVDYKHDVPVMGLCSEHSAQLACTAAKSHSAAAHRS